MQFQIRRRRHAVLLAKGPVEGGVVPEPPLPTDLPHGGSAPHGVAAGRQPLLQNVLVDAQARVLPEQVDQIVLAEEKLPGQGVQGQGLVQVFVHIVGDGLVAALLFLPVLTLLLLADGPPQEQQQVGDAKVDGGLLGEPVRVYLVQQGEQSGPDGVEGGQIEVVHVFAPGLRPSEEIPVDEAEGRICASVKVPCPPAIPIAASGEIIDRDCIELFRAYGIKTVLAVKK